VGEPSKGGGGTPVGGARERVQAPQAMDSLEDLARRARQAGKGFVEIRRMAQQVVARHAPEESLRLARALLALEGHEVRSLATFILGHLAAASQESLALLRNRVSRDEDWRVQEILAQAFDRYCADTGYERALPVIRDWLADPNPNVRRAVTEGLRIWTGRPYFRDNPAVAIRLLSEHRGDGSTYVRRSVGNALHDIGKKHRSLVQAELDGWDLSDRGTLQTYKLASR
jgi:HEAT repeat protein